MSGNLEDVRQLVYRWFVEHGRAPSPVEIGRVLRLPPEAVHGMLESLAEAEALVLLPGSPYIWMAEPFSAVPTSFVAETAGDTWFGNCVWDALGILAALHEDGAVHTDDPMTGAPLSLEVRGGALVPTSTVVHFAVPARGWWRSIGFT